LECEEPTFLDNEGQNIKKKIPAEMEEMLKKVKALG